MADDDVYQELPETPSQPQWDPPAAAGDDDLPDRLRVHSLARVLGTTSRRVLEALSELDGRSRSALYGTSPRPRHSNERRSSNTSATSALAAPKKFELEPNSPARGSASQSVSALRS